MSHSDDPVDEVERALMQIPYLLAQGIETTARVRVMRAERREHAERAGAQAEVRAAADAARKLQSERDQALPTWQRADDRAWVRTAEPTELFETWATATAWQEHDRGAAASAQRAEAEMRRRWPGQMRLYDDARVAGLPVPEAMRNMVTTATNAGWDPTRTARPQPSGSRPALPVGVALGTELAVSADRVDDRAVVDTPAGDDLELRLDEPASGSSVSGPHPQEAETWRADADRSLSPVERAMRYLPAVPSSPPHVTRAAAATRVRPTQPRNPRRR